MSLSPVPCVPVFAAVLLAFALSLPANAYADEIASPADAASRKAPPEPDLFDSGKLLATGGISTIEGGGGGGLSAWALITGYGTRDAIGGNAHYTFVGTGDYYLHTAGAAVGLFDRIELSYARQWFDTREVGGALGLGNGWTIHKDVYGLKVKLFGDAVYDQDKWWLPQVAVGLQYKKNDRGPILTAIGARDDEGVDYYLAATKLFLDHSLLVNGTVRLTKANQTGLLGFGGVDDDYEAEFEGSAALLLSKNLAVGVEYRTKPDNLGLKEDDWADVFVAYFPTKNVSLTVAYVHLGNVAIRDDQQGVYASLQVGF